MRRIVLLMIILIALPAVVSGQNAPAPPLALKDLKGRTVRLSDFRGKVVLVNFWATWCPPCRAEMPDLVEFQRRYRARGLQVIGITYPPNDRTEIRRFVRQLKVNYPIVLGSREARALFDEGEVLPLTVVIDREGVVRELIEGILLPEEFEQKIKPLLQ